MTSKTTPPPLMTGSLRFVCENEDGTEPISLKQFKINSADENPAGELSHGNIIPKNKNAEQHIIFDCFQKEYDQRTSFKLFMYENGSISGKIEYPIDSNFSKENFKGSYLISKSKITIWGVWAVDANLKERYLTYIELSK